MRRTIPTYVDALLKAAGLSSDAALRAEFIKSRDVTTLSLKTRRDLRDASAISTSRSCSTSGDAKSWIVGRQLIDLIAHFPIALDAEQLRALTRPLAPRAYSIASSRARGRRRGASAGFGRALRRRMAAPARASRRTHVAERLKKGARAARQAQAEQAFRAARARPRHHHGRPRHRRRAVPRLRAGAPRHAGEGPQLAVLRRPQLHPRLPLSDSNGRTR